MDTHLFASRRLAQEYAQPSMPQAYKAGYEDAQNSCFLQNYLAMVLVLDRCRQTSVMPAHVSLFDSAGTIKVRCICRQEKRVPACIEM